jgi:hypothetical protein
MFREGGNEIGRTEMKGDIAWWNVQRKVEKRQADWKQRNENESSVWANALRRIN